jgi:PhoPQ-activated pathogenicity-related protein
MFLAAFSSRSFNTFLDPLVYKDRLTMPKYIITSSNDEFFQAMDDHFWWDQMPGKNLLLKTPHGLEYLDLCESGLLDVCLMEVIDS